MSDACHARDGGVHAGGEGRAQHLGDAPHHKHQSGEIETGVVHCQYLSGAGAGEGEVLLQQEQQQKDHHTQQEIVGMYHRKGGFAGEGVQLGELPVEYPAHHGENRIEQGTVHIAFH